MSYSEKLRDPRWQKKRLEIMQRDEFKCQECADTESTLHVHHARYLKHRDPWEYDDALLVTLCEACHGKLHEGELSQAEQLSSIVMAMGGNAFVLGVLIASIDYAVPSGRKISFSEWMEACSAFTERLKEIVERDE